ncbi:DUF3466 family protein [Vibrio sp. JC009]|uniref:DUF3466 family protein n=1 Tax=Vibrio sp. JC009 TaxID=2912314 RepID=UPI0023B2033F|nr:DUF3466 family protein [Vibrio sp. JC009]WED22910.1 DUF3466 family protein [Vibrio sp. JC009]
MIKAVQKLLLIPFLTLTSHHSYAALYRIVESDSPTDTEESYGIGIGEETGTIDCFEDSCGDNDYELVGDTLNGTDGLSYKEEVAFGIGNRFNYLDYSDLESYCENDLGYSTCDSWAENHWYGNTDTGIGGLENEREAYYEADYQTNATTYTDDGYTITFTPDSGDDSPSALSSDDFVSGTDDKVVNAIDESGYVIGNTSSGYYNYNGSYVRLYRSRGFFYSTSTLSETVLEPEADTSLELADDENEDGDTNYEQNIVAQMGRTMAFDSFSYGGETYIVGSAAVAPFYYEDDDEIKDYDSAYTSTEDDEDVTNCVDYTDPALYPECQNFGFATRAYIWNISDSDGPNSDTTDNRFSAADWETDTDDTYYEYNDDEASAQASIRSAVISNTGTYANLPVLVGYNTYIDDSDNFLMQAAIFRPSSTSSFSVSENAWETSFIEDVTVEVDDAYIHSHSIATGINENMIVIGYAKRDDDYPYDGVTDNRMFLADANDDDPSATFFTAQGEDIFFDSAHGNPNAINNYNEIVGQVDAEDHREVSGKQRDHRGFIYPYNDTGTDSTRRARFNNQAWWLDDLTNGGDYSSANNHFRVIDAGDINDAGVISATALQCFEDEDATSSMAYDSTDHFAYCNDGSGDERIVAVKLIPIAGATSSDISEREEDSTTSSRSGAGVGWLFMLILSMMGFYRRIKSA